ncbi:MAG: hypothetical protein IKN52_10200 [Victivallales bacterium]|nr:hypothetical protein [Victivallales bacterium]
MKMIAFSGVYDILLMAYGFKLSHDVVFSSAKRMKTAEQTEAIQMFLQSRFT